MAFCEGSVVNEYIRSCNDTLFKTKIDEIDTPFKTKSSENHTLSGRTSPLRPYRGVSPRGGRLEPGRTGNGKCTGSGKKRGQEGGYPTAIGKSGVLFFPLLLL